MPVRPSKPAARDAAFQDAMESIGVLFHEPDPETGLLRSPATLPSLLRLFFALAPSGRAIRRRPAKSADGPPPAARTADWIDAANALSRLAAGAEISTLLAAATADALAREPCPPEASLGDAPCAAFILSHADRLAHAGFAAARAALAAAAVEPEPGLSRVRPDACAAFAPSTLFRFPPGTTVSEAIAALRSAAARADPFADGRAFRLVAGQFAPAHLSTVRPPDKFYGYTSVRARFHDFFKAFAEGRENLPLLVTGLPGLGKTHFTISHALSRPNLSLVLAAPGDLQNGLERAIHALARRPDRRFVIFFDDVDARHVDWYQFRTHVGGAFSLPANIAIVVSSNYEFPANILSRGRSVTFPLFDEIMCQEMVGDFLRCLGMRNPPANLISVIAADYVEEFGQRVFEELSPRTLARYLDRYERDHAKRARMLELSRSEIVTKPDAQTFFEANQLVLNRLGERTADTLASTFP